MKYMKNRLATLILMIFVFFTLGVGQIWAWSWTAGTVYFDDVNAWGAIYFRVGTTSNCSAYSMTKVDNTLGLYKCTQTWSDYTVYAITNNCKNRRLLCNYKIHVKHR